MVENHISEFKKHFEDLDVKYPNRHKEIHKVCCKNCPSNQDSVFGKLDEESQDIKDNVPKEIIVKEYLFVCYQRNSKLCKGLCDNMEIDQEYIDKIYNKKHD